MITIDLLGVKDQLTSSSKVFSQLTSDFSTQSAGNISSVIPQLSDLGNALPGVTASIGKAISSIGTAIIGESTTSIPKMQAMVNSLVPDTSKIQDLCSTCINQLNSGVTKTPEGLLETILGISSESKKVASISTSINASINQGNNQAESDYQQVLGEVNGFADVLSGYCDNIGAYLFNPSGNTPRHFSELLDSIKTDKLEEIANSDRKSAIGIGSGAITSVVYQAASTLREANIRLMNKSFLYAKAELELGQVSSEISEGSGLAVNRIRNTSPEQKNGI